MFKKYFDKYREALIDCDQEKRLYKKYVAKNLTLIIFFALVLLVCALSVFMAKTLGTNTTHLIIYIVSFSLMMISGLISLIFYTNFKTFFKFLVHVNKLDSDLNLDEQQREVYIKTLNRKKAKFYIVICVVWLMVILTLISCVVDSFLSPDSNLSGVFPTISLCLLILSIAVWIITTIIYDKKVDSKKIESYEKQNLIESQNFSLNNLGNAKNLMSGESNYEKREESVSLFNAERVSNHHIETAQSYANLSYKFPSTDILKDAFELRQKSGAYLTVGIIVGLFLSFVVSLLFFTDIVFSWNLDKYILPVFYTVYMITIFVFAKLPFYGKIRKLENAQLKLIGSNQYYGEQEEIIKITQGYSKYKGKLIYLAFILTAVLGFIIAIFCQNADLVILMFIPLIIGVIITNIFKHNLDKKVKPLVLEIKAKHEKFKYATFKTEDVATLDFNKVFYKNGKICTHCENSWFKVGLGLTNFALLLDQTNKVVSIEGNLFKYTKNSAYKPENAQNVSLCLDLNESLIQNGFSHIDFDLNVYYDEEDKILTLGKWDSGRTTYRVFGNFYVQFNENNLVGIMITGLELN